MRKVQSFVGRVANKNQRLGYPEVKESVQSSSQKESPCFQVGQPFHQYAWMYHTLHPVIKGSYHVYH